MRKNYFFKTAIAAIALTMGLSASAQEKSMCLNFENALATDFSLENTTAGQTADLTIENSSQTVSARSGSKLVKLTNYGANTGIHFKYTPAYVVAASGETVHMIMYYGSSNDEVNVTAAMTGDLVSTPTMVALTSRDITSRKTTSKASILDNTYVYARLRTKSGATLSNEVYCDDIVMYAHTNTAIDLTAPVAATVFTVENSTKTIGWTEGVDANTGVQKTYILRSTNTSATVPVLMPQVVYSVGGTLGDWTVIGEVNAGTVTYTDATAATGTNYIYAIVHRDLAYNNSEALVSSTVNYTASGINRPQLTKVAYLATKNGVEFRSLNQGEELSIYSMTGAKVFGKKIESSVLAVDLAKGIYMVRIADKASKVVVK